MGLEPMTSAVTGRHSNQLNYRAIYQKIGIIALVAHPGFEPGTP